MNLVSLEKNKVSSSVKDKIWLFYGEPGTWKTTVAAQFENVLLISFDPGYKLINDVYAVEVANWAEFKDIYEQLKMPAVRKKFDVVFIDGLDIAARMAQSYAGNGKEIDAIPMGKGWARYKSELSLLSRIPQLGYGYGFIAHTKKTVDFTTKEEVVKLDLDSSTKSFVMPLVDMAVYVQKEIRDGADPNSTDPNDIVCYGYNQSFLAGVETKSRARYMNDRFLFTYNSLEKELENAVKKQGEAEGFEPILVKKTPVGNTALLDKLIAQVKTKIDAIVAAAPEQEGELMEFVRESLSTDDFDSLTIADMDALSNLAKALDE